MKDQKAATAAAAVVGGGGGRGQGGGEEPLHSIILNHLSKAVTHSFSSHSSKYGSTNVMHLYVALETRQRPSFEEQVNTITTLLTPLGDYMDFM